MYIFKNITKKMLKLYTIAFPIDIVQIIMYIKHVRSMLVKTAIYRYIQTVIMYKLYSANRYRNYTDIEL